MKVISIRRCLDILSNPVLDTVRSQDKINYVFVIELEILIPESERKLCLQAKQILLAIITDKGTLLSCLIFNSLISARIDVCVYRHTRTHTHTHLKK